MAGTNRVATRLSLVLRSGWMEHEREKAEGKEKTKPKRPRLEDAKVEKEG